LIIEFPLKKQDFQNIVMGLKKYKIHFNLIQEIFI